MKTIKEEAKEYISEFGDDAFMAGAEFAQRWIPVEEELPPPYTFILCKCSLGDYYISCSNAKGEIISSKGETITHWRPIERE